MKSYLITVYKIDEPCWRKTRQKVIFIEFPLTIIVISLKIRTPLNRLLPIAAYALVVRTLRNVSLALDEWTGRCNCNSSHLDADSSDVEGEILETLDESCEKLETRIRRGGESTFTEIKCIVCDCRGRCLRCWRSHLICRKPRDFQELKTLIEWQDSTSLSTSFPFFAFYFIPPTFCKCCVFKYIYIETICFYLKYSIRETI